MQAVDIATTTVPMAETSRRWLVCYDVEDDAARERCSRILSGRGERVQYSVFLCWLTGPERMSLVQALRKVAMACVSAGAFDLRLYPVLRAGADAETTQQPTQPAGYWLV
jgi:CRISPR-associated endonuclease Cas2